MVCRLRMTVRGPLTVLTERKETSSATNKVLVLSLDTLILTLSLSEARLALDQVLVPVLAT
jgi:hypothetical protein